MQLVVAEEPVEGDARLIEPAALARVPLGFEAGRDHGRRFDGLLVEARFAAVLRVKAVAADGCEHAVEIGRAHV